MVRRDFLTWLLVFALALPVGLAPADDNDDDDDGGDDDDDGGNADDDDDDDDDDNGGSGGGGGGGSSSGSGDDLSDQDEALEAVRLGRAVPLALILERFARETRGAEVINARLRRVRGLLLYEITYVEPDHRTVRRRYYYAATGEKVVPR